MIQETIYICEQCGDKFSDRCLCLDHEAYHYGLTRGEYHRWGSLARNVRWSGRMVSVKKNSESDRAYDEVIDELIKFARGHNLRGEIQRPSHF